MNRFTLHQGDSREVLKGLAEGSVDSVVCDPPYHLTNNGGGPHNKKPNAYSRAQAGAGSTGFMGMAWDGGDVAQDVTVWAECLRVLKPGGYLLAFSGTRTYHRMTCAIEDAGFEIRDQIGWAYGSGFPKSHNGEWGGTALKPAWEPICMARKPLVGTVEANWLAFGTGALNIDGCRIEGAPAVTRFDPAEHAHEGWRMDATGAECAENASPLGRWPANLVHDGSDEVVALFPDSDGQQGDVRGTEPSGITNGIYGDFAGRVASAARNDSGSAARFFYCAKASAEDRHEGLVSPGPQFSHGTTLRQVENATQGGTRKGNHHPTVKPTDLMAYLCRLVTPKGGVVLDPFMGSGSTGKAAMLENFNFIGIDLSAEYVEIARARIDFALRQGYQPSLLEAAEA